jgi:hypothetical protein
MMCSAVLVGKLICITNIIGTFPRYGRSLKKGPHNLLKKLKGRSD